MSCVRLDLNNPEFQDQLFRLEKADQRAVLLTLKKLSQMAWSQMELHSGDTERLGANLTSRKLHNVLKKRGLQAQGGKGKPKG